MKAQDLIYGSLKILGTIAPGETPTADEMSDALTALNDMLALWSADNLMQPGLKLENFSLVAGTPSYSIGTGQTFNTAKPIEIKEAFIRDSTNYDYPLNIQTSDEYYSIPDIGLTTATGIPEILYYDPGLAQQTSQSGTIYLYPAPDKVYTLYIKSLKYFTSFATLTDTFTFPDVYRLPIKYSLAIILAPIFGAPIPATVVSVHERAMRTLTNSNSRQLVSTVEFGKRPSRNIYTFR